MTKPTSTSHLEDAETTSPQSVRTGSAPSAGEVTVAGDANTVAVSGRTVTAEKMDAFAVLEALAGSISAPADWAAEHDHYLYGTPKRCGSGG